MKAIKKFLALLLTAVMAFTVVPVFAAQSSSVPEKALSAGRLYGYRVFDDDDTLCLDFLHGRQSRRRDRGTG